jgi:hypothetical protein
VTVILDDDMMMLKVEAEGRKLGQPFSVVASARGRPRYDPDRGALFFEPDNVTIEDLTLRGSSGGDRVENRTGRLKDRLGEIVKDKAAAIDISAAKIAEQGIKLYLSTFPIYRVKEGAKGLVVRAVLRAVAIENSAGRHLLLVGTDISCCHLRIADARARGRSSAADPLPGVGPITHAHLEAAATEPRTKFDSS